MQQLRRVHLEDMFEVNGMLSFGAIKVSSPHPGKHLIKFKYHFCIIIDNYNEVVNCVTQNSNLVSKEFWILSNTSRQVFVILRMIHVNKNFLFVLCKIASGNSLFGIGTDLNWIAKNIFIVA